MSNNPIDLSDFDDEPAPAQKPGSISARAMAGQEPAYLKGLNPEQRDAVLRVDGPLLGVHIDLLVEEPEDDVPV